MQVHVQQRGLIGFLMDNMGVPNLLEHGLRFHGVIIRFSRPVVQRILSMMTIGGGYAKLTI